MSSKEDKVEPITTMSFRRKNGGKVRMDLGDGRIGWITPVFVQNEFGKYVDLIFEFPRSVLIDRAEVLERAKGNSDASDK